MYRTKIFPTLLVVATTLATINGCSSSQDQRVEALLRVKRVEQPLMGQQQPADHAGFDIYKKTQIALITSPYVLNCACRDPRIAKELNQYSNPAGWLNEHLVVSSPDDSEIISVSMKGVKAEKASLLVDAVVHSYATEIARSERNDLNGRLELLRSTRRNSVREIQQMTLVLGKLEEEVSPTRLPREIAILTAELTEVRKQLVMVNVDLAAIEKTDEIELDNEHLKKLTSRKEALQETSNEIAQKIFKLEDRQSFSSELETKKMELANLRESTNQITQAIHRIELNLKTPPRIELIQNATLTGKGKQMARLQSDG